MQIPRVHAMALLGNLMTHINYFNCKFTLLDPAFNDPTLKFEAGSIKVSRKLDVVFVP